MHSSPRLKIGIYFAPDPRPSASNEVDIYECGHCKMTITRRKGESGPASWDGGKCSANNGGNHWWIKKS